MSCGHEPTTGPLLPDPVFDISAGSQALPGSHFFFLPPLAAESAPTGPFDDHLQPVVEICALAQGTCSKPLVAEFTTTGSNSADETIRVDREDELYVVNWHTRDSDIDESKQHRIRVLVAGTELGSVDVHILPKGRGSRATRPQSSSSVAKGQTLPIKFRIEQGAVFVVGPSGGNVSAADGLVGLNLSPGALNGDVGITVRPISSDATGAATLDGSIFDFGPDGLAFDAPTYLTIFYDVTEVPPGIAEASLRIQRDVENRWDPVSGSVVNEADHSVTAIVDGFSIYGVGFELPPQPDFRLPLPADRHWRLNTEIGTPTADCPGGIGGRFFGGGVDCFHKERSLYSLDFADNNQEDGELTGVRDVPILAAADGRIPTDGVHVDPGQDLGCRCFGNYVIVEHANGFSTLYGHLKDGSIAVTEGQEVTRGQLIGVMGTSGESDGIHLHFEIRYGKEGEKASAILDHIVLDGLRLRDYTVGTAAEATYYLSTNEPPAPRFSFQWLSQSQFSIGPGVCDPAFEYLDDGLMAYARVVSGSNCAQYTRVYLRIVPESGDGTPEPITVVATVDHTSTGTAGGCSAINSISPWVYQLEKCGVASNGTYELELMTNTTYRVETNAAGFENGASYRSILTLNVPGT